MKVEVDPLTKLFFEVHAKKSTSEVMGWMIGKKEKNKIHIFNALGTNSYTSRSVVHAETSPEDMAEISNTVPLNLGILGMYHSHPVNVFHSSTDDNTLLNFTTQVPGFVSAVTNREITKFYQVKKEEIKEIKVSLKNQHIGEFTVFTFVFDLPVGEQKTKFAIASEVSELLVKSFQEAGDRVIDVSSSEHPKKCFIAVYGERDVNLVELESRLYYFLVRYLDIKSETPNLNEIIYIRGVPMVFPVGSEYLTNRDLWIECWLDVGDEQTARQWIEENQNTNIEL